MIQQPTILLTIDVEDWFQVENLRSNFPFSTWDHQTLRVEKNIHQILDLLDSARLEQPANSEQELVIHTSKHERTSEQSIPKDISKSKTMPRATFFILGWIAERLPNMVREIHNRGHEVASHGYNHCMCNELDGKQLKQDLIESKQLLEGTIGDSVNGYRAPNFSISDATLKLIQDCGYRYDSSYNNFSRHGRYGKLSIHGPNEHATIYKMNGSFYELPITNLTVKKFVVPWGGGGYFRFLPSPVFLWGVENILKKNGSYMFYLHPWEIDPDQPRAHDIKWLAGWKHYLNLSRTYSRIENFLAAFRHCQFQTCTQFVNKNAQQINI